MEKETKQIWPSSKIFVNNKEGKKKTNPHIINIY